MELSPYLNTIYKNELKWIKDIKTITLFEVNIKGKLHDIGFANEFLYIAPKTKATVTTTKRQTGFHKNVLNCVSKVAINRVKRQSTNMKKILGNHISD